MIVSEVHNTYHIVQALGKTPDIDHKYHCQLSPLRDAWETVFSQKCPSDTAKRKPCKGEGMLCNHLCEGVVT